MAYCADYYQEYVKIVEELIEADPKYKNYNEIAKLILSDPELSEDQIYMSLNVIGSIFNKVNTVNPGLLDLGNWKDIEKDIAVVSSEKLTIKMANLKSNNIIRNYYGLPNKEEVNTKLVALVKQLQELPIVSVSVLKDIVSTLSEQIKEYGYTDVIKANVEGIRGIISAKDKSQEKLFLQMMSFTEKGEVKYKRLDSIEGITQYQNNPVAWVLTRDYVQTYVIVKGGKLYELLYNENGLTVGNEILVESLRAIKHPDLTDNKYATEFGKVIFSQSNISEGMTYQLLDNTKEGVIRYRTLVDNPGKITRILAVKTSENNSNRIAYINSQIENRKQETFETEGQKAYLKNNPNSVVVTVARPNEEVIFLAEGEGTAMSLYGLSNYVFVDSNNNTTKIDFNNPEHLKQLERNSVKRIEDGSYQTLQWSEIIEMQRLSNLYDMFIEEVTLTMQNSKTLDVTPIFKKYYEINSEQRVQELRTIESKIEDIRNTKNYNGIDKYVIPLTITRFENGQEVESYEKEIAVVMTYNSLLEQWEIINPLANGEFIVENGEKLTFDEYFDKQYINTKDGKLTWQQKLQIIFKDKNPKSAKNIILMFSIYEGSYLPYAYQLVEGMPLSKVTPNISYTLSTLYRLANSTKKQVDANETTSKNLEFKPISGLNQKSDEKILNVGFGANIEGTGLTVYFKPYNRKGNERYNDLFAKAKENKILDIFSFDLNETKINKIFEGLTTSKVFTNFVNSQPNLIAVSETITAEEMDNVVAIAYGLSTPEALALTQEMSRVNNLLVDLFKTSVINNITETKEFTGDKAELKSKLFKEFVSYLKEDLQTKDGQFVPEYLLLHKTPLEPSYDLNLMFKDKSRSYSKYGNPIKSYKIVEQLTKGILSIKPKVEVAPNKVVEQAVNEQPVQEEIKKAEKIQKPEEQKPTDLQEYSNDIDEEDAPFELSSNPKTISDIDRVSEDSWLKNVLGQVQTKEFENIKLNDNIVLGYVKDYTLFLNKELRTKGTLYHEAFHYTFRYLLDVPTRNSLTEAILTDGKYTRRFSQSAINVFKKQRNINPSITDKDVQKLMAEEILADKFKARMERKQARKESNSLIAMFLEWLEKLLNIFNKREQELRLFFDKIDNGSFNGMNPHSFTDIVNDNSPAYSLIPTVKQIIISEYTGKPVKSSKPFKLSEAEQTQLVNMVVAEIAKNNLDISFEKKFEMATTKMLEDAWSFNTLYSLNNAVTEEDRNNIKKAYQNRVTAYRFILGDRMKNDKSETYDINLTGLSQFDNKKTSEYTIVVDGETKENTKGEYSNQLFKELVEKEYEKISTLEGFIQLINIEEEIEDAKNNDEYNSEEDTKGGQSSGDKFDDSIVSFNIVKQNVGLIRKFLSTLTIEYIDPITGFKIPASVDPSSTFNMIAQMTSNLDYDNIIPSLLFQADIQRENGFENEANVLLSIYNSLVDKEGNEKNQQFNNLFKTAFQSVELSYLFFSVNKYSYDGKVAGMKNTGFTYILKDKLIENDVTAKRKAMYQTFASEFANKKDTSEYILTIKTLKTLIDTTFNSSNDKYFFKDKSVDTLSAEFTNAFNKIGIAIPKSVMKMSLLQAQKERNPSLFENKVSDGDKNYLNSFSDQIKEELYLKDTGIKSFYNTFLEGQRILKLNEIVSIVAPLSGKVEDSLVIFDTQLRKTIQTILKFDPTAKPSVSTNAEGKPIYRYVRPNPLSNVANSIRRNGLLETLQQDELWLEFLQPYAENDPIFGKLLKGVKDKDTAKLELYLKNFTNGLYGGVQQSENYETYKDGKNFQDLDEQTMLLLAVSSFLKRRTLTDTINGELTSVDVFYRQYHQNESISTNYLVTSIYNKEHALSNERIIRVLEGKIIQEFERIRNAYLNKESIKEKYDEEIENNLFEGYNVKRKYKLVDDQMVQYMDFDDTTLRAYNFSVLNDFFADNKELNDELLALAKSNSDYKRTDALMKALNDYANNQFKMFLDRFEKTGILKKEDGKYTYTLLPKQVEYPGSKTAITTFYSGSKIDPVEAMLRDLFFNDLESTMTVNSLIDGDIAMNVKNKVDLVKRYKKLGAAGSTGREGEHKVLFLNTISEYINEKHPVLGPYRTIEDIMTDPLIKNYAEKNKLDEEELKEELKEDFIKSFTAKGELKGMFQKTFDGQSIQSIYHTLDMLKTLGRVNDKVQDLLIQKMYRPLSNDEIAYLNKFQVSLNSKKTVTSSRHFYLKLSEMTIDRNDVSILIDPITKRFPNEEVQKKLYAELDVIYKQIYALREENKTGDHLVREFNKNKIRVLAQQAHKYFVPNPASVLKHNLLNTMEYDNIDQVVDTEASKNTTLYGLDVQYDATTNGYFKGDLHSKYLRNDSKYWQVETSGIHEDVAYSVQRKLLGIADLLNIEEILKAEVEKSGKVLTKEETASISELNVLMHEYQSSLRDAAQGRLDYFKSIFRKDGELTPSLLYDVIRQGLEKQGAAESVIKFFKVNPDGTTIFNTNFPIIRNMLEYYIFSMYSKNITDEKTVGRKYIHESAWNQKVIYNTVDGKIVRRDQLKATPWTYITAEGALQPGYSTRQLSSSTEEINGKQYTVVEVMISMPKFKNDTEKEFYIKNMMYGVGTRIPTEDKRSMVAFKIVDFVDASKQNAFVMPFFAHMLAGSDFDVDSLYAQHLAHYEDMRGNFHVYNDYSGYDTEEHGQFVEFINYMKSQREFKTTISDRIENTKNNIITSDNLTSAIKSYLEYNNYSEEDFALLEGNEMSLSTIKEEKDNIKALIKGFKIDAEGYGVKEMVAPLNQRLKDLNTLQRLIKNTIEVAATLDVLNENNIPIIISEFQGSIFENMVSYKYQNENLKAFYKILSNEVIFNRLYINQRSSTQAFKDLLKNFGDDMTLDNFVPDGNMYSITYKIAAKLVNASGKDGISKAASMNKFFALANQINARLNQDNVIWQFKTNNGNEVISKYYDTYGQLADSYTPEGLKEKQVRTIEIIGNILGMFADAAKDPIPGALGFNEINTGVALSMIGLGMPFEFVIGFNFIGSIRDAIQEMQEQSYGITSNIVQRQNFFTSALMSQINKKVDYMKLKDISYIEYEYIDKSKLTINWKTPDKGLTPNSVRSNQLSSEEVGYTVSYDDQLLPQAVQEYILLNMYKEQVKQSTDLMPINSATSGLFKSLVPDINKFNKIDNTLSTLKQSLEDPKVQTLFTRDTVERLLAKTQVFSALANTVEDLSQQLDSLFIERTPIFSQLVGMFQDYYSSPSELSQRMTGFLMIKSFIHNYMKSELESSNDQYKDMITKDRNNMLKAFEPFGNYSTFFPNKVKEMQTRFPNNAFLSLLYVEPTGKKAKYLDKEGKEKFADEKIIRIFATTKLKDADFRGKVENDLDQLQSHNDINVRMFVNELFFKELARTGVQNNVTGTFLNLFVDMLPKVSRPLDVIMNMFNEGATADSFVATFKELYGLNTEAELVKFFNDMANQFIYGIDENNVTAKNRGNILFEEKNKKTGKVTKYLTKHLREGETKEDMIKVINHIFKGTLTPLTTESDKIFISLFKGDTIKLDFNLDTVSDNINLIEDIASKLNIRSEVVVVNEKAIFTKFIFPPFMKWNDKVYVIKSIDGKGDVIGKGLLDMFATGNFELSGKSVEYIKLETMPKSTLNKAIHLSMDDVIAINKAETEPVNAPKQEEQEVAVQPTVLTQNDLEIKCSL